MSKHVGLLRKVTYNQCSKYCEFVTEDKSVNLQSRKRK